MKQEFSIVIEGTQQEIDEARKIILTATSKVLKDFSIVKQEREVDVITFFKGDVM